MKPMVCAVMLVNGRELMVRRAIASFRAQTYERKRLVIWDTTPTPDQYWHLYWAPSYDRDAQFFGLSPEIVHNSVPGVAVDNFRGATIGRLRNAANKYALAHYLTTDTLPDIIAHWDSDDWSHPRRLEEQVELLEASGKMCVGYREALFWDTRPGPNIPDARTPNFPRPGNARNESWLYRNQQENFAIGASYCYRRELWEQQPFLDAPHEDRRWWLTPSVSRNCVGVSGLIAPRLQDDDYPRMVCGIHGTNTEAYDRGKMSDPKTREWRRTPEHDTYCAGVMQL